MIGQFKDRLRNAPPQIGIRSQLCSPLAIEALGHCGYDFAYIDMEHSPADLLSVVALAQALGGTPTIPVVRIPELDVVLMQRLMDLGVHNLVVPMVQSVEMAREAVEATRYPPRGTRSVARIHRGNGFGADASYQRVIDDERCLILQAETKQAIDSIAEIAGLDGVDGVLIGSMDLAADLGYLENPADPAVHAVIGGAIKKIRAAGKIAGMSTSSAADAVKWIELGCQFMTIGSDAQMLVTVARTAVGELKSRLKAADRSA